MCIYLSIHICDIYTYIHTNKCVTESLCGVPETNTILWISYVVVQAPSRVQLFVTPWTAARQASLCLTISWSLPTFMFIALVMPSSHLILWHPLLLLLSILPSIGDFSKELAVCIMTKILELQLQHQSFRWIFRVDFPWDWLVLSPCCPRDSQRLLQDHSWKALILWCSAFFIDSSHNRRPLGRL